LQAMRVLAALLVLANALAAIASGEQASTKRLSEGGGRKAWVHPKTPWVPLQRPEAFGTRTTPLTEEEFAQRQAALKRQ
jgi:hypothetical protein